MLFKYHSLKRTVFVTGIFYKVKIGINQYLKVKIYVIKEIPLVMVSKIAFVFSDNDELVFIS